MLLGIFLYNSFDEHMYSFLLHTYLGVEWLCHRVDIRLALINIASFLKQLCSFALLPAARESSVMSGLLNYSLLICGSLPEV